MSILDELFSEETLQGELDLIKQMALEINNKPRMADFFAAVDAQTQVDNMIEELPIGPWTSTSASLAVTQLVQAVELVPVVRREMAESRILERAMLRESANCHLTVYRWYIDVGPTLARVLFHAHRQGSDVLIKQYPTFEPLVDHIFRYVQCVFTNKTANGGSKPKRRKRPEQDSNISAPNNLSNLEKVPANLFGLLSGKNTKLVKLPPVTSYRLSADLDNQYGHAVEVFLTFFSDHIIVENMKEADNKINSGCQRSGDDSEKIRSRCINRGALLSRIVEVFNDDDGIFACPLIERLLTSPSLLFNNPIRKDADLSARIIANPAVELKCLSEYVTQLLSKSPTIISIVKEIGDAVFEATSTISNRPTQKRSLPSQIRKSGRPSKQSPDTLPPGPVCLETLLGGQEGAPFFGQPALMIRELLNYRRGRDVGDEMLRRVLEGLTPTTGGVLLDDGKDSDHFMPLRWDNKYARLLMKHLPPRVLVTPLGFSSLLVYMATGQGNLTTKFIENNAMSYQTLDEAVATFQRAHDQNALGEAIVFDNMKVWGQSAKALSFKAKKGMTIREKLAPFFEKGVQDAWMQELGPGLANHPNPKSYDGKRPTWSDITKFAKEHKLHGLMDGLTQLQFANNLVLAGIVSPPTVDEISRWIARHPKLGAYGGLKAMGFRIAPNKPGEPWVRAAFQCVYDHLDLHLSPEDKAELGFGVIFVEHILCKLVRWQGRFKAANIGVDLASMAKDGSLLWVSGGNLQDSTGQLMPAPTTSSKEQLKQSIANALVSSYAIQ